MKRKRIKISVIIIGILILSNFLSGYINFFTEGLFRTYLYQTENAEFEFTTMPAKGRDIGMMERQFSHFKDTNPEFQELELRRTFKRNPLKFWNWYSYLTHKMYDYEYQTEVKSISEKGKFGILKKTKHNMGYSSLQLKFLIGISSLFAILVSTQRNHIRTRWSTFSRSRLLSLRAPAPKEMCSNDLLNQIAQKTATAPRTTPSGKASKVHQR